MQNNLKDPFSIKNVCQTLLKNGLLTNIQIKEISKKKDVAREKLERQRAQRLAASRSELKIVNPITIIDVIVSLELSRADKPSWPLDEEIIYQTLAKKWNLPYKKIPFLGQGLVNNIFIQRPGNGIFLYGRFHFFARVW